MPSCSIVLPGPVSKVSIQKGSKKNPPEFNGGYTKGYEAGYKAGMLQAEFESKMRGEREAAQTAEWIRKIEAVHTELSKLALSHIPQLVLAAVSRILEHHKFTDEEIGNEVETLIKELSLAKSISIECSANDLEKLKSRLEENDSSLTQAEVKWTTNPDFQAGEFVIQSDLGVLDGRRTTRLAHVHAALNQLL